eukprot:gnl/TRDRNA2_/TRDRNA2_125453_c0_seq1.p1 gnl/TRDRNA2_/TRDRNA2_125453_c0~~gnl/TRDRNA2_/TRDRNA2_125453_c0_seq1.p1  ORF type:complete len:472 (-),score=68.17 gnl/TRDRNA2_/TRDRNA2_125453_c0_seq1:98-1513(-)
MTTEELPDPAKSPWVRPLTIRGEGCRCLLSKGSYLALEQEFVVVRHGNRLDHTPEWEHYEHRHRRPHDSPLTKKGMRNANSVGQRLLKRWPDGHPYRMIWSSPYYRCVQTAAEIALSLDIPVCVDRDLGEVFDDYYMPENKTGEPMDRSPEELGELMKKEYPKVRFAHLSSGALEIHGKQPPWPEDFFHAQMRFAAKFEEIVEHAVDKLMSVVIVTHGDAIPLLADFLLDPSSLHVREVPYCAFFIASRVVAVADARTKARLPNTGHALKANSWIGENMKPDHKWKVLTANGCRLQVGKEGPLVKSNTFDRDNVKADLDHRDFNLKASIKSGLSMRSSTDSKTASSGSSSKQSSTHGAKAHVVQNAEKMKKKGRLCEQRLEQQKTNELAHVVGSEAEGRLCKAGHQLESFKIDDTAHRCEVCHKALEPDTMLWHCQQCDFDVCAKCCQPGNVAPSAPDLCGFVPAEPPSTT